jgi:hypothetical protein
VGLRRERPPVRPEPPLERRLAFAEHQFRLAERDDKGFTYREHLEGLSERKGMGHPDLDGPPLPEAAAHVWRWYCELAGTTGEDPIGYPDIDAWRRLTGRCLAPWEVAMLVRIDACGRKLAYEALRRRKT